MHKKRGDTSLKEILISSYEQFRNLNYYGWALHCLTLKRKIMFIFKKKPLSEDDKYVIDIVDNFSKNTEIKKMISPISDEYYLLDETNKISICISDEEVIISNHIFLYKKMFNLSFTDELKKQVRENMEKEMQTLRKKLFKNETSLLSNILKLSSNEKVPMVIRPMFKVN